MSELLKLLIGIAVLLLGIPIGSFIARLTKEELKEGQKWFKVLILIGIFGAGVSLYLKNDYLLFTFLFIAITASRSLRKK
ncbi:hypothetical protein HYT25_02995 [Candidatus Pacearchaeota archaeon]|nr:hypothetical protein [Candidatus Pacearchaeota archaeon]